MAAGDSRGSCGQDRSGAPLQFAPEYTFNAGVSYDRPVGAGMRLALGTGYLWSDDTVIANDLDPELIEGAVGKLNANLSPGAADDRWRVSLIGRNLTDEKIFSRGNDVPLAAFGFSGTYFQRIDPPAYAELLMRFSF